MCTILIAHQIIAHRPLLVLANRDEFYNRPTGKAEEWPEMPGMFAGRDLASGGTWFGARNERWASITNIREGKKDLDSHHKSRGWLVLDYLQGNLHPKAFLEKINSGVELFAGYNLLLGDGQELWYASNRIAAPVHLEPGIYGLSNAFLETPWPKVVQGKTALEKLITSEELDHNTAFSLLADTTLAEDKALPQTGVPYEWEKALSAIFVRMANYGTRCSTLLTRTSDNSYHLVERSYLDGPSQWEEKEFFWKS